MAEQKERTFELGTPYQLAEGHRRSGHRLFYLGTEKEMPYPDGQEQKSGPAHIFACGTRESIERRQGLAIVVIPVKSATGEGNIINCPPSGFVTRECWNYPAGLPGEDHIEQLLTQPLFPNKSTPKSKESYVGRVPVCNSPADPARIAELKGLATKLKLQNGTPKTPGA